MIQADSVLSTPPTNASAINQTSPSRRGFLAQAAGVAAGSAVLIGASALAAPATAAQGGPDPILPAIEVHKATMRAVRAELDVHTQLEIELPPNKRQSDVNAWEELIIFDDDPRWIASERAVHELWDAENAAAVELVNVLPTTAAGLMALLQYAIETDTDGEAWPRDLVDGERSGSWHHFLIANIAEVLPGMIGSQGSAVLMSGSDLEDEICNIASMSDVCDILADNFASQLSALKTMNLTGKQATEQAQLRFEVLAFAVCHLGIMTRAARGRYMAELEARR
jgi:hypothetical protein